jgi:chromosomal replication initiation ATPase DnaA
MSNPLVTTAVHSFVAALQIGGLLRLVEQVCLQRGVTLPEVCSRARTQNVARTRHEIWWRIRHLPERQYSYAEIGALFGRDHSTIKCAVDAFQRRLPNRLP